MKPLVINSYIKLDQKSIEKSKYIREIFEVEQAQDVYSKTNVIGFNKNVYFNRDHKSGNFSLKPSNKDTDVKFSKLDKKRDYIHNIIDNQVKKSNEATLNKVLTSSKLFTNYKQPVSEEKEKNQNISFFTLLKNVFFGNSNSNFETNLNKIESKKNLSTSINSTDITHLQVKEVKSGASFSKFGKNESNPISPIYQSPEHSYKFDGNSINTKNSDGLKNTKKDKDSNLLFIPCLNCNNMIHMDEIESHSNKCNSVQEEIEKVESSKFTYHVVDFKMKKIQDHINSLISEDERPTVNSLNNKNKNELNKETHIFHILGTTIKEVIEIAKISSSSMTQLKKHYLNINVRF